MEEEGGGVHDARENTARTGRRVGSTHLTCTGGVGNAKQFLAGRGGEAELEQNVYQAHK